MSEFNEDLQVYGSGVPIFDYCVLELFLNETEDYLKRQCPSIGLPNGCFITGIEKHRSSRVSTMFVQASLNIVKLFPNSSVIYYDLEQALTYSRIQKLSGFKMDDIKGNKYILRSGNYSIDDIKQSIICMHKEKMDNLELYQHNIGSKDELGNDIIITVPTIVVVDPIEVLHTKINENDENASREEINNFFTELLPYLTEANIIVLTVHKA